MGLTRITAQQISDIDYKQAVRVITLSNITLSGGAPVVVDGVTLLAGNRILVTGQSTASQNGLYYVSTLGTGSNGTWTRTSDGDVSGEIESGMIVMVTEGTSYADTSWKLTTNDPITIGSTALTFELNTGNAFGTVSANGTAITANTASGTLTLTPGNNISIVGNSSSRSVTIGVTGLSLNSISNGTSNVNVVSSGGNVTVGVGGTGNVVVVASTGEYVTGVLSVSGNANVGNLGAATVAATTLTGTLSTAAQTNITSLGTLGSLAVTGNITSGNLQGTSIVGTLTTAAQTNITSVGTLGSLSVTGNITGGNLLINTDAVITGNLTVQGNTTTINSNVITTNDLNITVGNNQNTGAALNNAGIDVGNNNLATWRFNNATTSWQSNIAVMPTANGTLALGGASNYWGAAYVTTLIASGNANVGNLGTAGNITAGYFFGNGSQLTGISVSTSKIYNGTSNVDIASANANVTVSVNGTSNLAVFSPGSLLVAGAVTGVIGYPKTITSNVQVADDSTAVVISPLTIANGASITVPTGSTLYVWLPS